MAIIILAKPPEEEQTSQAKEDYPNYIKLTVDIEKEIVAMGGEFHADAEKMLLAQGSLQENIWGGGLNLETKELETSAIINLRGGVNDSLEILNPQVRDKFIKICKKILKDYVK